MLDLAHPSTTTYVATFPRFAFQNLFWLDDETVAWWRRRARAVFSRNASGTGPTSVVVRVPGFPVWSPDSTKIAYSKVTTHFLTEPDLYQLFVRDLDSGRVTAVSDSVSESTGVLGWTKDDRLFFTRNIAGEGVHIKIVEDGGRGPSSVVGTLGDVTVSINPACG